MVLAENIRGIKYSHSVNALNENLDHPLNTTILIRSYATCWIWTSASHLPHADSDDTYETANMLGLNRVSAWRIPYFVGFDYILLVCDIMH